VAQLGHPDLSKGGKSQRVETVNTKMIINMRYGVARWKTLVDHQTNLKETEPETNIYQSQ